MTIVSEAAERCTGGDEVVKTASCASNSRDASTAIDR